MTEEVPEPAEIGETDVDMVKQELAQEKEKAGDYLATLQRVKADFENYKKRVEQDRNEQVGWANAELVKKLLPVLDDLDRAFANLPCNVADPDWVEGLRLIHRKFLSILESEGLVEVECEGEHFDPAIHDAVMQQEGKEGVVLDKVCKGYKLKDRWLRAPQVIVGKGFGPAANNMAGEVSED